MVVKISWAMLALLHLLPALALVRPTLLTSLYGVEESSPVFLLLWHRAALFAMALIICLWALVRPEVRQLASVALAISMVSFLALYWFSGSPASLRTIALADLAGLPFLGFVVWNAFRSA